MVARLMLVPQDSSIHLIRTSSIIIHLGRLGILSDINSIISFRNEVAKMKRISILPILKVFRWYIALFILIAAAQIWISNDLCSEWKKGGYYSCHYGLGAFGLMYLQIWACTLPFIAGSMWLVLFSTSLNAGWRKSVLNISGRIFIVIIALFLSFMTIAVAG